MNVVSNCKGEKICPRIFEVKCLSYASRAGEKNRTAEGTEYPAEYGSEGLLNTE